MLASHGFCHLGSNLEAVRRLYLYVSVYLGITIGIGHDDRDGIVLFQYLEHQVKVGVLSGSIERVHRLSPYLHTVTLLLSQVLYKEVAGHKRCCRYNNRSSNQRYLYLPYLVSPVHKTLQKYKLFPDYASENRKNRDTLTSVIQNLT